MVKYLRGAAGIGLDTTTKYLRRTASADAASGLGSTAKYLVNQIAGAVKKGRKATSKGLSANSSAPL
jgi:hypothetical protein